MAAEAFGAWSLVPPLLAIALAIVTRKAILSLFLGVWSGGVIFRFEESAEWAGDAVGSDPIGLVLGVPVALVWGLFAGLDWVAAAIGDSVFHAQILIFTLLLGSAVAMIWRLGGSHAVRNWALDRIHTQRRAGAATYVLGLVMFFDDYANTAIVGSTMKDVSDRMRVSKEKFSYIVDSTAAPVATLALSSWVAFQISMVEVGYEATDIPEGDIPSGFEIFLQSIPFNMYSILAIVMVGIIVFTGRDYGEMLTAEHRSWNTGLVSREDARPLQEIEAELGEPSIENPRLRVFFVPVLVLVAATLLSGIWTGWDPGVYADEGLVSALGEAVIEADYAAALLYGSFVMVLTTFYYAFTLDLLPLGDAVDTVIDGFGLMLTAVSILVLAWSIGEVVGELGTGEYVAGFAEGVVTPEILPVIILFMAAFIAFSTGTSWGTMAILTPIAVPIVWELTGDHTMVAVVVGTIFSGAIFGDHSSPISDTSVLSATFTGADLIDHVRTQLYYAVTVVIVASVLLLVWSFGEPIWGRSIVAAIALLPVGVIALFALVYGLSEFDAQRRGIDPIPTRTEPDNPVGQEQSAVDAPASATGSAEGKGFGARRGEPRRPDRSDTDEDDRPDSDEDTDRSNTRDEER